VKCDAIFNKDGLNLVGAPEGSLEKAGKAGGGIVSGQGDRNKFDLTGSIVMGFGREGNGGDGGVNMDVSGFL
jgi:hypothetical protein